MKLEIETGPTFKIDGVYCRLIPLSKGQYAIVWESDYLWLMQWKWYALWAPKHNRHYAVRHSRVSEGDQAIYMHRQILGLGAGDPMEVDHKDPMRTLDNRRDNIRNATRAENMRNQTKRKDNTTGFKGVHYHRKARKWTATIWFNGECKHLGLFATKEEAYAAYCAAATELYGEFARFA